MRKNNTQKIEDVVNEYLKSLNIDGKLKEVRLIRTWDEVVGKTIARSTRELFIKDRKLFVKLNSSIVRNELFMLRDGLKKALNDRAGEIIIDEIILK